MTDETQNVADRRNTKRGMTDETQTWHDRRNTKRGMTNETQNIRIFKGNILKNGQLKKKVWLLELLKTHV
jgi:hypothetical protein